MAVIRAATTGWRSNTESARTLSAVVVAEGVARKGSGEFMQHPRMGMRAALSSMVDSRPNRSRESV
jgi:hypothetical protein